MRKDSSCGRSLTVATVASIVVLASLVASCAAPISVQNLKAIVLADATQRSASYCARVKEGCEIDIGQTDDGGWTASIVPIVRATGGVRVYGIDSDDFYIYRADGSFKGSLRNYH